MSSGAQEELEHVCRLGKVKLFGQDFDSLADNRWLTSDIIDAALTLVAEEVKNTSYHVLTSEVRELLRPGYKVRLFPF